MASMRWLPSRRLLHERLFPTIQSPRQFMLNALSMLLSSRYPNNATTQIPQHLLEWKHLNPGKVVDPEMPPPTETMRAILYLKQEHLPAGLLGQWQYPLPDFKLPTDCDDSAHDPLQMQMTAEEKTTAPEKTSMQHVAQASVQTPVRARVQPPAPAPIQTSAPVSDAAPASTPPPKHANAPSPKTALNAKDTIIPPVAAKPTLSKVAGPATFVTSTARM